MIDISASANRKRLITTLLWLALMLIGLAPLWLIFGFFYLMRIGWTVQ
jgi:hypothetical protein